MHTTFHSMNELMDPDFPLKVKVSDDGLITIEWDEEHPKTKMFNNWSADDFHDAINRYCLYVLEKEEQREQLP